MWLLFALGSAFFAGITAVLAKLGIHGHDSTLVTALRTSVVFLGAWIVAAISVKGHFASELTTITPRTYLFLFLSGLATGASWLCFFAALSRAPVTLVSPIDKSSTIIAIAFAVIFLGERLSPIACIGVLALAAGITLTLEPGTLRSLVSQHAQHPTNAPLPNTQKAPTASWIVFALASAIFAALTSILGKVGITGVDLFYSWPGSLSHFMPNLRKSALSHCATTHGSQVQESQPRPRGCATTERSRRAPRPSLSLSTSFQYW